MKVSKKDFTTFKEQFSYWIQKMGLLTWEYVFEYNTQADDAKAYVMPDMKSKMCRVVLMQDWGSEEVSHKTISRVAFHEAHEVKYAPIANLLSTFYSESLTEQMIHEMIKLDETCIFEPHYTEKYET